MNEQEREVTTGEIVTMERPTEPEWTPLFGDTDNKAFRCRWDAIQSGFVDDPREAVQRAEKLVADTMKRLASIFADERAGLEGEWAESGDVSTEDLRQAIRRYRSFFNRLLAL